MKSDVVVVGAELDSFVSALRLAETGAKVRLLLPGGGSLHYWTGGLGILNLSSAQKRADDCPFEGISELRPSHPYRLVEVQRAKAAIYWFLGWLNTQGEIWNCQGQNVEGVTTAGQSTAVFAFPHSLATFEALSASPIAIVAFENHLDFLPELCASGMSSRGISAVVISVAPPVSGDSVRIARAFDECDTSYFKKVSSLLPNDVRVAVFPAVLGLSRHASVIKLAESTLGVKVFEIATLPPSLFGLRLHQLMLRALRSAGVALHPDVRGLRAAVRYGACECLIDNRGREYRADKYVASNGGVLMGGLEIDSWGIIRELIFDLDVHQTEPLNVTEPLGVVDALHRAGVITDETLRPTIKGRVINNVHVTGALLAYWNPIDEVSNEGVAIATGYAAADFALGRLAACP